MVFALRKVICWYIYTGKVKFWKLKIATFKYYGAENETDFM